MWGILLNEALTAQISNTNDMGIFDSVEITTPDITKVCSVFHFSYSVTEDLR